MLIAGGGCDLQPRDESKPKIFALVGHPDPMSDELILKLRFLAKKGATVAFLRDEKELQSIQKNVEVILVESMPVPEPSDFDRIEKDFVLRKPVVINPDLIIDQPEQNHFIPKNQRIPANCRRSNRYLGLNRRIMRRWIGSNFGPIFFNHPQAPSLKRKGMSPLFIEEGLGGDFL